MRDARATAFPPRMKFLGSARVSRAGDCVLAIADFWKDFLAGRQNQHARRVRYRNRFVGRLRTNAGWQPALPDQD